MVAGAWDHAADLLELAGGSGMVVADAAVANPDLDPLAFLEWWRQSMAHPEWWPAVVLQVADQLDDTAAARLLLAVHPLPWRRRCRPISGCTGWRPVWSPNS